MEKIKNVMYGCIALACLVFSITTSMNFYKNITDSSLANELAQIKNQFAQKDQALSFFLNELKSINSEALKGLLVKYNIK